MAHPDPTALYQSIDDDFLGGDLQVAVARADQARKEYSATGSFPNPGWELKFRLLEADILLKQSRWKDVIPMLNSGAPVPAVGDPAVKWNLLSSRAHHYLGQPQQANQELHAARRLAESGHSALMGDVLRTEALVERDAGHLELAMEKFRSSLAVAREHRDSLLVAADLVDIGHVSLQSGQYDQALALSQQAANFARSVHARRQIVMAIGNIGWAYQNLGDFENALSAFLQADAQAKEVGMDSLRVVWLQDAGLAQFRLGNLQEARKYDEKALQAALRLPTADEIDQIVNIETNLALLLYHQGQYDAAKTYSDKAKITAGNSGDVNVTAYAGFVQALIAARRPSDQDAERLLLQNRQMTTDPEIRMEIENALAHLYSDSHRRPQAELWYRRSIQTFEGNRSAVQNVALRLSSFAYGDTVYRDYAEFLVDSGKSLQALQLLDRSRARTLQEGLEVNADTRDAAGKVDSLRSSTVDAPAVARKLNATILFYSLGAEKSFLWAVTAHETHLFTLPKQKDIQVLVEAYQRSIQKFTDPRQTLNPTAITLYETLIKPAAVLIAKDSKVYIIPNGILYALNFETLLKPTPEGFKYWIEDVAVTVTSSIRILSHLNEGSTQATKELLLIGNPVSPGNEFPALGQAADEIQRIQKHFSPQGQSVFSQAQAVPAAYMTSSPDQFKYVHFVAHGTASRLSPLDSAVVLSPSQKSHDDFKLYARDIVQHPLHAKLVTISACYGSGLRTYAGEGLVGLAWAFLRAGSHYVISAIWEVNDDSTPLLMDQLYAELKAGSPPDVALRAAKLSLINAPGNYRKPFYWATFELYAGS